MRVIPRFRANPRRALTFGSFTGPPDEKSADVFENGRRIGWIVRETKSEQKGGSSRAWTHTVTGYTAFPENSDANEKTFEKLADARAYVALHGGVSFQSNPARRGERYFDGRLLLLEWRHIGLDAKEKAFEHAALLRKQGKFVRIVRVNSFTYSVYGL